MKLEEAKKLYDNEWIAFRANKDDDDSEGEVLFHNKNRKAFDKKLLELKPNNVYITFAGPVVPEGYAIITRLMWF